MREYQLKYIDNIKKTSSVFYSIGELISNSDNASLKAAFRQLSLLKQENSGLLEKHLFPALDELHSASAEEIGALEEFSAALMDRKVNLDCGVYILIHDSLLSLARVRKDRASIIRELYDLGMGHYYLDRMIQGVEHAKTASFSFENEMLFTEAGAYLKYFENIEDEETKGYIIRSLANISICTQNRKRRVAVSSRILNIVQDEYYRNLAPGLPWDLYLKSTHQQMSSNRNSLSKGDLTSEELAAILESCSYVFEPEKQADNPNVRWLWPYYEMEYSCGFVDLDTTLNRMEELISGADYNQYDTSGLYANVQLPIYYGRLLRENPSLKGRQRRTRFLTGAYRKMMKTLLSYPIDHLDDFFYYDLILVIYDYYEAHGTESYRNVYLSLMKRFNGMLYLASDLTGRLMEAICSSIYEDDPAYFSAVPALAKNHASDAGSEAVNMLPDKETVLEYAYQCGLMCNTGLMGINISRLFATRNLFEGELQRYMLHTDTGSEILRSHESTRHFADIALGHHRWYNGSGGYPEDYVRLDSPYRLMTDVAAVAVYIIENRSKDYAAVISEIIGQAGRRFSPVVASYLGDNALTDHIFDILQN